MGNLPPSKEAQIHLQVVGELGVDAEGGVRFSLPSCLKPRYTLAGSTDPMAVMIKFYPQFTDEEVACEFVFLVDRSDSIRGSYIRSVHETGLFLKNLPEGSYFNILDFGSSYQKLFPDSVPYDEQHLDKAMPRVGRQILEELSSYISPLKDIFGVKCHSGYPCQIFVLIDGSVNKYTFYISSRWRKT